MTITGALPDGYGKDPTGSYERHKRKLEGIGSKSKIKMALLNVYFIPRSASERPAQQGRSDREPSPHRGQQHEASLL